MAQALHCLEDTIVKNPDVNSLLFFEQVTVKAGDTVQLTLKKDGFEKLVVEIKVEY